MLSAIEDCTLSARAMLARRDVDMLSAVNVKGGDCVWHLLGREDVEDCKRDFVFGRDERLGRRWIHPCGCEDACARCGNMFRAVRVRDRNDEARCGPR